MENVKERLAEKEKQRKQKNKKRKRIGLVFASVCRSINKHWGFYRGFYELLLCLDRRRSAIACLSTTGLGERLNLEAESNGVKIKIKSVIADDVQTLVFYEIEDTVEDNQYLMDYYEGVFVENEHEIMNHEIYPRYYPPDLESNLNKKKRTCIKEKLVCRHLQRITEQ